MGRTRAKALPHCFEVRVRKNHHVVGIQVWANNSQHAGKRVGGHIVSIREIKPDDVRGDIEKLNLSLTYIPPVEVKDTYSEDLTLDSFFFGNGK